jgi:phosphoglycerol transferase MdoB-like AlkP superfamily enzyme
LIDITQKQITNIRKQILFLISYFTFNLIIFQIFRVVLFFLNLKLAENTPSLNYSYPLFNRGLLFDISTSSYLTLIPYVFIILLLFFIRQKRVFLLILIILLLIIQFFVIGILSVDIPYFAYYNARISNAVLNWSEDFSIMFKTVFLESYYLPYLIMFFFFFGLSCFFIIWIFNKTMYKIDGKISFINISTLILIGILLFFGSRGETNFSKKPFSIENAYFSDYSFPNQLGINPVYSFIYSFKNQRFAIMSNQEALERVKNCLNRKGLSDYPLATEINFSKQSNVKPNVVIVIVESLCNYILRKETNGVKVMPFLDSLSYHSITFENIYSSGIHTYNGLYSILCGLPSLLNIKPLTDPLSASLKYSGISNTLKKYNYKTLFICSGDKTFDNMNSFTLNNDFDRIISKDDFPDSCLNTFWGASDNFLFDKSLAEFDELYSLNNNSFLGVILTSTSHEANTLPKNVPFRPKTEDYYEQLFEFTDWSINHFIEEAKKREWFKNTLFVFIGDHGQRFDPTYDMSLTYHHIPMIFFWEKKLTPKLYDDIGLQLDLFPTLMGIIKLNYINNTLGIDLRTEKRPYAFFTADNKIGVLDKELFLVIRTGGPTTLYKYRENDVTNYLNDYQKEVDSMKTYVYSMLQATQWLIEKKKTNLPLLIH